MIFPRTKRAFEVKYRTFFLDWQVLSFRLKKQTSKNVADATFKINQVIKRMRWKAFFYMNGSIDIMQETYSLKVLNCLLKIKARFDLTDHNSWFKTRFWIFMNKLFVIMSLFTAKLNDKNQLNYQWFCDI